MIPDKDKIQRLWFGKSNIAEALLLTPIQSMYKELLNLSSEKEEYGGWYAASLIKINNNNYFLAKIPMGKPAEDITKIFNPKQAVHLLGYCGGLETNLNIGDMVQDEDNHLLIPEAKKLKIQTMNGLLDNNYLAKSEAVDMENELFKKTYDTYSSYFIISDLPRKKAFYNITKNDRKKIYASQTKLIEKIGGAL